MKVICISGKAQHGKDTAAMLIEDNLEALGKKVLVIHYADLLKWICQKFFGWNGEKDEAGRTILQYVGTDTIRKQNEDYWVDFVINFLKMFETDWDFVLIPDTRFVNEAEKMRANFDTVVLRIERPGFVSNLSLEQQQHPSETSLDNYEFDTVILNDSTLEAFKAKITEFVVNLIQYNKSLLLNMVGFYYIFYCIIYNIKIIVGGMI